MAFVWQDKENGVDDILAKHINDVAHEVIRLEKDKVNKDLSNVEDVVFKNKATSAGVAGKVSSVNGKIGDVVLSANDVKAYLQIPGIKITGRGIEIHSNSDKNMILFAYRDDGSFAVHDLTQKADKATTLSGYGIEDAYNKDEVDDKIKQASIEEVEYSDIDNIIESGVYKLMQGEGTTRQGDGMWLVVSRTSDPIDSVIYVIQYMFSSATSEIKSRTRNPMSGEWFDWESIGNGSVDLSNVSDEAFLDKLNAVLPDGDEVSY